MKLNGSKRNCPNCGAPVTTEVCPYCNIATDIDTRFADMEYPVIECKEAGITFWNFAFPMIFAVSFGFFGFVFPLSFLFAGDKGEALSVFLFCSIFGIIGVVAFVISMVPVVRTLMIMLRGKNIEAVVYGYMDDNVLLNNVPAQIVKLLVTTNDGKKFILYQLGDIKQPFKVNSRINLKVYKDIFLIENKKKYYFE